MKLKLKLLVAAAALAAAGQASAAISTSQSGNGELFLSVYDSVAQMSYTRDLGITIDGFVSSANSNLTFAADSLLSGFKGADGLLNTGITWGIGAADGYGVNRYLTTTNAAASSIGTLNNGQLKAFKGADVYLGAVNDLAAANFGGSIDTAVNSSVTATPTDGAAYVPANIGDNWVGNANFSMMGNVGQAQNFFLLSTVGTTATAKIKVSQYANALGASTWNLGTDGKLSYSVAAVPEADTWAMFGVGLLMVGAIARRRMQA